MLTARSGGDVRDKRVPSTNFMIRKMFFGLMVLENILQVALLNKDSLLPSWLLTDREKKAFHCLSANSIKPWLSTHHFPKYIALS